MKREAGHGLERSCAAGDWVRVAPDDPGLERIEAGFSGPAYAPHRHDTYAIGLTLSGVQAFAYRGARRASPAGHAIVLHPDEVHDGEAGTEQGFRYRMIYVEPAAIRAAMADPGGPLPFVPGGVCRSEGIVQVLSDALGDLGRPLGALQRDDVLARLADALAACAENAVARPARFDGAAMARLRELMTDACDEPVGSAVLERASGYDRYSIARQFRACFGTSPHRFLVMRRLDRARRAIRTGTGLAEAAALCGFADQSHLTRHFKAAYGISPGRWLALQG